MKKSLLFLLLGVSFLWSCKKDDDGTQPAAQTKTQLVARTWEVQSGQATVGALPTLNIYTKGAAQNPADLSKFRLAFNSNGQVTQTNIDGSNQTGTWKLGENDTKITISGSQITDTWTIDNLTDKNLDISRTVQENSTNPADQNWIQLAKTYGVPTTGGIKLAVKLTPVP
ncbi:hypothetical protein [Larkinella soli]|uniref:hypothetical protein n=1 Tax=Larkinella soli TaxID=1770527 RepID=UPI000FFB389A|nr:hypothetical protein [Larkinella soli]